MVTNGIQFGIRMCERGDKEWYGYTSGWKEREKGKTMIETNIKGDNKDKRMQRDTERHREKERERVRGRERERGRGTDRERNIETEKDRETERQRERDREMKRHRETDTGWDR